MPDNGPLMELRIPCDRRVYRMLLAGLPVFSIRLEDQGDGTHSLIVIGANGPLSDPFGGVFDEDRDNAR